MTDNIIIFAHPDDETLFFYDYITSDSLLILVTEPNNKQRLAVLNNLVSTKGCKLMCLSEPDNYTATSLSDKTKTDLLNSIKDVQYKKIITHNTQGEYGHKQHKLINQAVTSFKLPNTYYINFNPNKYRLQQNGEKILDAFQQEMITAYANLEKNKIRATKMFTKMASNSGNIISA